MVELDCDSVLIEIEDKLVKNRGAKCARGRSLLNY